MPRISYVAIVAIAALAAAPGNAQEAAGERLSAAIHHEMAAQGPIIAHQDRMLIAKKCGHSLDETKDPDIRITGDTLYCANGRHVPVDNEIRAMTQRISARAQRHVDRAMKSAAVARAQAEVAQEAAARAMEEVRPLLRQR